MGVILAVDTDLSVNKQHEAEWANRYGIDSLRVNTMCEAVVEVVHKKKFHFIVINEDNIKDAEASLKALRSVTEIPIFVLTSDYALDKKVRAMHYGADLYEAFSTYIKDQVYAAFDLIQTRGKHNAPGPVQDLVCGDLSLSLSRHKVAVGGAEVHLSKKEFDILQQLMANPGCVVTHAQLLQKVWGSEYNIGDVNVLWRTMDRLRKKLPQLSCAEGGISVERGVGYRLSVPERVTENLTLPRA